ncbi:C-type lectin domain family 4 member A-like isoform X1 [Stigmatopora nigra]
MAEELNYVAVKFNTNQPPTEGVIYDDVRSQRATWSSEKRAQAENIYDDVSSKETTTTPAHPTPILKANGPQKWRRSVSTPTPTAAILAALCLLLASAVLAMALHAKGAADELDELRRRWRPLGIERQRLNRTLEAVLALDVFHVMAYCPQRVLSLCTACPRHWLLFGSKCYLFLHHQYSGTWKSWEESAGECRRRNASLLTVASRQEQEFVTNQSRYYNDVKHGYWMALTKDIITDKWGWRDGSVLNQTFWRNEVIYKSYRCGLLSKSETGWYLDNWSRASCYMKNRYVCQMPAFLEFDQG